jgi:hypothetical protein
LGIFQIWSPIVGHMHKCAQNRTVCITLNKSDLLEAKAVIRKKQNESCVRCLHFWGFCPKLICVSFHLNPFVSIEGIQIPGALFREWTPSRNQLRCEAFRVWEFLIECNPVHLQPIEKIATWIRRWGLR